MLRNILFAFALFHCFNCLGQVTSRELAFPQVGWTLTIPEDAELLTSLQFDSLISATKKKTDLNFEMANTEVLFMIKKNEYNYFGSTVTLFDSTNFDTWESAYVYYKKIVVELIESNKPMILLLDSASSTESIDGLIFQKFYMKTEYPKQHVTLENYWYYRKQDNIELSINIAFANKEIGDTFLAVLKASRFDK